MSTTKAIVTGVEYAANGKDVGIILSLPEGATVKPGDVLVVQHKPDAFAMLLAACEATRAELAALAEDEGEDRIIGNYDDVIATIDAAIAKAKAQ